MNVIIMRGGIAGFKAAAVFAFAILHALAGNQRRRFVLSCKPDVVFECLCLILLKCCITLNGFYLSREADRICFDV